MSAIRSLVLLAARRRGLFLASCASAVLASVCSCASHDDAPSFAEATQVSTTNACDGLGGIGSVGSAEALAVAEIEDANPAQLHLAIGVDDEAIKTRIPSYEGSSVRAFACVPLRRGPYGTGPNFRRVDLTWRATVAHQGRAIDVHNISVDVYGQFDSPSWSFNRGVYFGLESSAGIVWAQWPGQDLVVLSVGPGGPTKAPLPGR